MNTASSQNVTWREAASGNVLRVTVYPGGQFDRVAEKWASLARSTASNSFFLSRDWVETWIRVFGSRLSVSVVLFAKQEQPVGVCLLVQTKRNCGLIPLNRISLNTAGENPKDSTYIEFNNLVCLPGWEQPVADSLAEYLAEREWDEFALDGFVPSVGYEALKRAFARFQMEEDQQPSYYVDLSALRCSGRSYDAMLSSHRRKMVRQSIRAYSRAVGALRLEAAQNIETAVQMFDELARLNCLRLSLRRHHSVFESAVFKTFHTQLIQRCFPEGSVELLRLEAGGRTIGILYNFVWAGKVYFYQCGFDYTLHARLSPGIVTLAHAVQHYIDTGYDDFDFLSGEASYKRMLSTNSRDLVWAVFRRPNLRVRIGGAARAGKRRLVHFLSVRP
jgi:CelD/BcsL family acetyltransferase involved in cellulose biosynthesis